MTKALIVLAMVQQENPINVCVVGDSGVGKSLLLNFCEKVAHKSFSQIQQDLFPVLEK